MNFSSHTTQSIDQSAGKFNTWYEFLLFFNDEKTENRELIIDYFFEQFVNSPEQFYKFVLYFKERLLSCKQQKIKVLSAERYLVVLSFLCERFGFYELKTTLDDLCFRITKPETYNTISKALTRYQKKSASTVNLISSTLKKLLKTEGFQCDVRGRYKNIYSIYRKEQRKPRKKTEKLSDMFAFRIVTPGKDIQPCFDILNLLHDKYYPLAHRFKNYITIPKVNGYQSLHTCLTRVVPDLDIPIEVQIRTEKMDTFAEKGVAAHWIYSQQKRSRRPEEKELKLMDYFSSLSITEDNSIYCLSYDGDIFKFKRGATIIDFANRIHSGLARRARGALVNGTSESTKYVIQEGDQIEIVTNRKILQQH